MSPQTLLLSSSMAPQRIISWQRAVVLVYGDKAEVIEAYDEIVRSPSIALPMPAVVRLKRNGRVAKHKVRFSRANVYARDGFRCQYCGESKSARELNYDHVLPRRRGGKTTWENIATSCYGCNERKGGRTPEEAGMKLVRRPYKPRSLPVTPHVHLPRVPDVWRDYISGMVT